MANISFKEVQNRCIEGRYFSYEGFNDKIFAPISVYLVWFFVRLGWSGNAVSLLSGVIAILGGILIASTNSWLVFVGSFGYMIFYLLDYVDGGVARIQNKSGIGGQFIDLIMHMVSGVAFWSGIFAGAFLNSGNWIVPFGILSIVACALSLARYAFGWFAICMIEQQNKSKGVVLHGNMEVEYKRKSQSRTRKHLKILNTLLFHENYLIFSLPILAFMHIFISTWFFDFRILLLISGAIIHFPFILWEVWRLSSHSILSISHRKLFDDHPPNLPKDHFFED